MKNEETILNRQEVQKLYESVHELYEQLINTDMPEYALEDSMEAFDEAIAHNWPSID